MARDHGPDDEFLALEKLFPWQPAKQFYTAFRLLPSPEQKVLCQGCMAAAPT